MSSAGIMAGKAFIRLSLNDKLFTKGLGNVSKMLRSTGRLFRSFNRLALVGGAAAAGGLFAAGRQYALKGETDGAIRLDEAFKRVGETFQSFGMSVGQWVSGPMTDFLNLLSLGLHEFGEWISSLGTLEDAFGKTFGLIADTVAAGEIEAASELLWANVEVIWYKGIFAITTPFKEAFAGLQIIVGEWYDYLVMKANKAMNLVKWVGSSIADISAADAAKIAGATVTGGVGGAAFAFGETLGRKMANNDEEFAQSDREADARYREAQKAREEANSLIAKQTYGDINALQQKLDAARARLQSATEAAEAIVAEDRATPRSRPAKAAQAAARNVMQASSGSSSLFDLGFASRVFGGGPANVQEKQLKVQEDQLDKLENIDNTLARLQTGGGIPVV